MEGGGGGVSRKEVFVEMVVYCICICVCVYDWYGKECFFNWKFICNMYFYEEKLCISLFIWRVINILVNLWIFEKFWLCVGLKGKIELFLNLLC